MAHRGDTTERSSSRWEAPAPHRRRSASRDRDRRGGSTGGHRRERSRSRSRSSSPYSRSRSRDHHHHHGGSRGGEDRWRDHERYSEEDGDRAGHSPYDDGHDDYERSSGRGGGGYDDSGYDDEHEYARGELPEYQSSYRPGGRGPDRRRDQDHHRHSRTRYHSGRSHNRYDSGSDASDDTYGERHPRRSRYRDSKATSSVRIKGLPEDQEEADLYKVFEGFPGINAIRVLRERASGTSKGSAIVEFESVEASQSLMETDARYSIQVAGVRLHLEYNYRGPDATSSSRSGAPSLLDWICTTCGAVNFARRLECYQCSCVRSKDAARVNVEPDGPSMVLKVSGLEPQIGEERLHELFAACGAVHDIRLVRDKFTGAPRGFAFVEFNCVAEASKALNMYQGFVPEGQKISLKIVYAKDRRVPASAGGGSSMAADALGAAHAMQQYSGWEPKEFKEQAAEKPSEVGKEAAKHDGLKDEAQDKTQSAFQYDPSTGYWHDSASGYYYDANTGLYYSTVTQQWYAFDQKTNEYKPCGTDNNNAAAPGAQSDAQAAASTSDNNQTKPINSAADKSAARRRGAIIGAAPQLNPQGLLAAAQLAQAKEEQQKLEAARAQKREQQLKQKQLRQQQQQQQPQPPSLASNTAQQPGAAAPGVAGLNHAADVAIVSAMMSAPPNKVVVGAGAASGVGAPSTQGGAIAGVIHRGKWSRRAAGQAT